MITPEIAPVITSFRHRIYARNTPTSRLLGYSLIVSLFCLFDALMAYCAPVYLDKTLHNSFYVGLIISCSSAAGMLFDFVASKTNANSSFSRYFWLTILISLVFPIILLFFSENIFLIIIAMIIWGVYYELLYFSHFHFIESLRSEKTHAQSWGAVCTFKALSYTIGPLLASLMIGYSLNLPLYAALVVLAITAFFFFLFLRIFKIRKSSSYPAEKNKHIVPINRLFIWKILINKLWLLWMFMFCLSIIDSAFWTIGALFSEQLKLSSPIGAFFLTLYMLPTLFIPLVSGKIDKPLGKKKVAFISGAISGALLIAIGLIDNAVLILLLVFLSSLFGALAVPEILATFEDYITRLGYLGNSIISIERSSENAGYIVGPIICGFLAIQIAYQRVFSVVGGVSLFVSIVCLIFIPRKIRFPQQQLQNYSQILD